MAPSTHLATLGDTCLRSAPPPRTGHWSGRSPQHPAEGPRSPLESSLRSASVGLARYEAVSAVSPHYRLVVSEPMMASLPPHPEIQDPVEEPLRVVSLHAGLWRAPRRRPRLRAPGARRAPGLPPRRPAPPPRPAGARARPAGPALRLGAPLPRAGAAQPLPRRLGQGPAQRAVLVNVDEVVRYEAGYAVVRGDRRPSLFFLAVPVAGLCFCLCRCRRRCGGRVKTEHKAMACERAVLLAFLLLTTLVLLPFLLPPIPAGVGVACAFATNQRTHEHTGPGVQAVPDTLRGLRRLVAEIPEDLRAVADQFSLPQNRVLEDLDGNGGRWRIPGFPAPGTPAPQLGPGLLESPCGRRDGRARGWRGRGSRAPEGPVWQGALCPPGVGERLGNYIHSQLKSKVYLVLASVHSLGQGPPVSGRLRGDPEPGRALELVADFTQDSATVVLATR
ncbi:LOW QUALITY PROTEIN: uncharacterized protein LOC125356798 [Perognathus longimembris pacificus]|uniref:LOW QUALITY PROTEIN: uncharacterized protein LOC125356798 n=1 Tax=Perognathus longimembris pacificus TaxID=214514 RepID=UPI0020193BA1|nr:LOW QUALITY PROTEIN: uncharacterized protein LOC125356798 [Perognathus longimembris pacificus]